MHKLYIELSLFVFITHNLRGLICNKQVLIMKRYKVRTLQGILLIELSSCIWYYGIFSEERRTIIPKNRYALESDIFF